MNILPGKRTEYIAESDAELVALHDQGNSFSQIAQHAGTTKSTIAGRIQRARLVDHPKASLFKGHITLEQPLEFEGDAMIVSDIHVPCTNLEVADRVIDVARKYLRRKRRLIINGDLFNMDFASYFASIVVPPTWAHEKNAAKVILEHWLNFFDDIAILPGNHERRLPRMADGNFTMEDIRKMVTDSAKVQTTEHGHVLLHSGGRVFRVTHGKNYSINQLWVANDLAHKFEQHIISGHQHHGAIGMDRFKRYILVDVPALVDQKQLAYVTLDDTKMPNMACGFALVKDGEPMIFAEGMTVWERHI